MPGDEERLTDQGEQLLSEPQKLKIRKIRRHPTRRNRRILIQALVGLAAFLLLTAAAAGWLAYRAVHIKNELTAATALGPEFAHQVAAKNDIQAQKTLERLQLHTAAAREAATDPLWKVASTFPLIGGNFSAVTEVSVAAEEIVNGAAKPLLDVAKSVDFENLLPKNGKLNAGLLRAAAPKISAAANTVELTHTRLAQIDQTNLRPEITEPLSAALASLADVRQSLNGAADAANVLPSMLGIDEPRNYLILVQNNAEVRATGGLPGALALLRVENGALRLTAQASASSMGKFTPHIPTDPAQERIYTTRLGTYFGDVNLTPDFPTAAKMAKAMWEKRQGTEIDGVVALDPVALAHLLKATGPVSLPGSAELPVGAGSLPSMLSSENAVRTLLSDVYSAVDDTTLQDAYFASVARAVFGGFTSGKGSGAKMLEALTTSSRENRIYVWSDRKREQQVLLTTPLGGSIAGATAGGAKFGVYFNDGTGAKMDYYIRRTVQLIQRCRDNERSQVTVRVTLKNTANPDAAASLPAAVTGNGVNGTRPGNVKTNTIVYGPTQSLIYGGSLNSKPVAIGSFQHANRPVGVIRTELKPGQSAQIEFDVAGIVQSHDPEVVVTPTIEDPAKVIQVPVTGQPCKKLS